MHLVFDLDGVLLDSETDRKWLDRAIDGTLRALDLPQTQGNRSQLFPISVDGVSKLADRFDLDPAHLWSIRDDHYVRAKLHAICSGELPPFDDIEILADLVGSYDLHIVSNSPQVVVDTFVDANGFQSLFGVQLGRELGDLAALHRIKPHPYMYHVLVDQLDDRDPLVYIGDTETDRSFASATGMRFIYLSRDPAGVTSLRELPPRLE